MITLNLTVRRHTTYGFTHLKRERNKPRPCKYPWSCAIIVLNPPHKGLVGGGLEQRLRGGTYSIDSVVYTVARQLYQYHRPTVLLPKNLVGDRQERCELESTPRILII